MAITKKKEIALMTPEQLDSKYAEIKKDLMKLNMQRSSGTSPENPGMIKASRKAIARILTYKAQNKNKKVPEVKQEIKTAKKSGSSQSKKEVSRKK
ncbi:MAG: 50S ribosomal protein L29 [Nanoarchaeota archaeon]|nr:50S ribosomal protein L29 [Nanoarchaeota archaeon]